MSGRKGALQKHPVIVAQSLAADVTGLPTNIEFLDNIGFVSKITGSPVGDLFVQVSADYDPNQPALATWVNITSASISAAGNVVFDLNQLSLPWIRLFYDRTSGTGSISSLVCGKMV